MALSHADHKRIALTVAGEIRKVLASHNGERMLQHRKDRLAKPPGPPEGAPGHEGSEGMDEMLAELADDPAEGAPPDLEEEAPPRRPPFPKKSAARPPPFKRRG